MRVFSLLLTIVTLTWNGGKGTEAMSDFLGEFLGGPGCAPDGSMAASNPMGHLMNSLFEGPSGVMGDMMGGGPNEGMMMLQHEPPPMAMGPGASWANEFNSLGGAGGAAFIQQQHMQQMNDAFAQSAAQQQHMQRSRP